MDRETRIAKVTGARLGWEDHGIFTCSVTLNYGGASAQGAGYYALDRYRAELKRRVGTAYGLEFIMRLMKAFGVIEWSDLVGRTAVAIIEDGLVIGIEPLPTENGEAFMFRELAEEVEV